MQAFLIAKTNFLRCIHGRIGNMDVFITCILWILLIGMWNKLRCNTHK
jgi:hypothetical protein